MPRVGQHINRPKWKSLYEACKRDATEWREMAERFEREVAEQGRTITSLRDQLAMAQRVTTSVDDKLQREVEFVRGVNTRQSETIRTLSAKVHELNGAVRLLSSIIASPAMPEPRDHLSDVSDWSDTE